MANGRDEVIDIARAVVDVERCAGRGGHTKPAVQWPGAVVAHPHLDAAVIEHLTDIVRVDALDDERDCGPAVLCVERAEDPDPRNLSE